MEEKDDSNDRDDGSDEENDLELYDDLDEIDVVVDTVADPLDDEADADDDEYSDDVREDDSENDMDAERDEDDVDDDRERFGNSGPAAFFTTFFPSVKLLLRFSLSETVDPRSMGTALMFATASCSGSLLGDVWFIVFIFVRSVIDG